MSVIGSNILAGASGQGGGYNLTRSLRFRSSASAYLSRTPASAGNRKTWTYSAWLKRGVLAAGSDLYLFAARSGSPWGAITFGTGTYADRLQVTFSAGASQGTYTTQVFRDPSAWYHIVVAVDTTQATSSNRIKVYVNGVEVTSFANTNYPSQNFDTQFNNTIAHYIGSSTSAGEYYDGYLTEVNFIDGQALTPSSFGETSTTTGVWQPKRYAGTYGTNGFYLPFTDNSALTTSSNVGLGKDFSGNGNYWTTNNISITSGATYDSMTDVPTLTSATASNFCVLSPIDTANSGATISDGNLKIVTSTSKYFGCRATIGVSSGKWYWEVTGTLNTSAMTVGIDSTTTPIQDATNYSVGETATSYAYRANGNKTNNNINTSYGATYADNDVIGVALDLDGGTLTFYKNGTSQGAAFSSLSGSFTPAFGDTNGTLATTMQANFGQRPFAYTPPTGFVALNTFNLPTPTIGATASSQAGDYFNIALYSGNSANPRAITGVGLQPDFVWVKQRSSNGGGFGAHQLYDSVRGTQKLLRSNTTDAELANPSNGGVQSFDSDGFTIQGSSASINMNDTGETYVSWNWKANGTGVTNTAGSITSTVSANTTSGFSVVTYTGNGSGGTVGHGLGVAPAMIFLKKRSGVSEWSVYNKNLSAGNVLFLNSTSAANSSTARFTTTLPTSSVFTIGSDSDVSGNGLTYVAYCFSEVAGYSKFGSYTGNGSSDGSFIYTGFKPRYMMIKGTFADSNWIIIDTARSPYNTTDDWLLANSSSAELTDFSFYVDALSNGFKLRGTNLNINGSGDTFVYACFAEHPFKYSLGK